MQTANPTPQHMLEDQAARVARLLTVGLSPDQAWDIAIDYEESLDARGFRAFEKEVATTPARSFLFGLEIGERQRPADVVAFLSHSFGWRSPADPDTAHDVALAFRVIDLAIGALARGC